MSFEEIRVTPSACPQCGKVLDSATAAFGGKYKPAHGDITLCISCGEWSQFEVEGDTVALVKPNEEALEHIGYSPEARRVRDVWVRMDKERKAKEEKTHE